jgi:hypothetical protein
MRRNQEEKFAGAQKKQERREVKPPLHGGGIGTVQMGKRNGDTSAEWERGRYSRLQGEKGSNTTPPKRLAMSADTAVV